MKTHPRPRAWPSVVVGTLMVLAAVVLWLLRVPAEASRAPIVMTRPLFDTTVTIKAYGRDRQRVRRAVERAFAEVARLDRLFNYYSPKSEVSRLNRLAATRPVPVSSDTARLLALSERGRAASNGAYDIRVGPLVDAWSFGRKERIPSSAQLARLHKLVSGPIERDRSGQGLIFRRQRMKIDLGSSGKGYAMDRAARILKENGVTAGLVTCGSSTTVFGRKPGGGLWRVAVEAPRPGKAENLGVLELTDADISTSGDYQQFFIRGGVRYHHVLDARTGRPARGLISVTVVMRRPPSVSDSGPGLSGNDTSSAGGEALPEHGAFADMMSTALMAAGPLPAQKLLAKDPRLQAVLVSEDGRVYVSPGLRSRLRRAVHRIVITGP